MPCRRRGRLPRRRSGGRAAGPARHRPPHAGRAARPGAAAGRGLAGRLPLRPHPPRLRPGPDRLARLAARAPGRRAGRPPGARGPVGPPPARPGAAASSTARRLSALTSFYHHLITHDVLAANPAAAVRRPRVDPDHTTTVGLDRARPARSSPPPTPTPGPPACAPPRPPGCCCTWGCASTSSPPPTPPTSGHYRGHRVLTVTRKGGRLLSVAPAEGDRVRRVFGGEDVFGARRSGWWVASG